METIFDHDRKLDNSLVHVVIVLVVGPERNESSKSEPVREEDLCHGVDPDLGVAQFGEVGHEVELDAEEGAGQCDASNEEDREEDVGEQGREVDHLSRPLDTFPDTKVHHDPDDEQRSGQLPTHLAQVVDPRRDVEHSAARKFFR